MAVEAAEWSESSEDVVEGSLVGGSSLFVSGAEAVVSGATVSDACDEDEGEGMVGETKSGLAGDVSDAPRLSPSSEGPSTVTGGDCSFGGKMMFRE